MSGAVGHSSAASRRRAGDTKGDDRRSAEVARRMSGGSFVAFEDGNTARASEPGRLKWR